MRKRARITDIAEAANVSIYSVSLTLNGKAKGEVSEEIQQRIINVAHKMHYKKHREAASLRTGKTFTVGLLIAGKLSERQIIGNFSLYQSIATITDALSPKGYFLNILQVDSKDSNKVLEEEIIRSRCDGIIIEPNWPENLLKNIVQIVKKKDIPCVITHQYSEQLPCTYFNYTKAGFLAASHLLQKNISCLAVINAETLSQLKDLKHEGIRKAIKQINPNIILKEHTIKRPQSFISGFQAGTELFKTEPYPNAIIITDNFPIPSLLLFLEKKKIRVPSDLEVIGIGDTFFNDNQENKFSYIPMKIEEQSFTASKMVLQLIEQKELENEAYSVPIEIIHNGTTKT